MTTQRRNTRTSVLQAGFEPGDPSVRAVQNREDAGIGQCLAQNEPELGKSVLLENMALALLIREFTAFVEHGSLLSCLQEPVTKPYPEAVESVPHPTPHVFKINFNIVLPFKPWSFKCSLAFTFSTWDFVCTPKFDHNNIW
jgi:hypothetical protein